MKIISFDVGIKNLAFCLFEKTTELNSTESKPKILKWDVVDIAEEKEVLFCEFMEKNSVCNKPAKFQKDDTCYCLKHSKKQNYQIPKLEQKTSFIHKQTLQKLYEIADKHNIQYAPKIKKTNLVQLINDHIQTHYFQPIEMKKAGEVNLYTIGLNIKNKLNKLLEKEERIDYVIIENQIGPIATRMKTIQGMIVQYFIMSPIEVKNIEFISAINKLKVSKPQTKNTNTNKNTTDIVIKESQEPNSYSERKKQGVAKCLEIITDNFQYNEFIEYFKQHKKKDDLADSFLQGIWFIDNRKL
jgi:hypothetical protein